MSNEAEIHRLMTASQYNDELYAEGDGAIEYSEYRKNRTELLGQINDLLEVVDSQADKAMSTMEMIEEVKQAHREEEESLPANYMGVLRKYKRLINERHNYGFAMKEVIKPTQMRISE